MVLKVIYFAFPGRAETTRMILDYGKIPYEDVHIERAKWPEMKLKMPYGQVPVLELEDGKLLAQSGAIERYVAKLAGLYPQDPLVAAFADSASFLVSEIWDLVAPTFHMSDLEARIQARHELLSGRMKDKLLMVQKLVEHQPYLAGSEPTFADFQAFAVLGGLKNGEMDGIPKTLLDDYPGLKAHFNRIANLPAVKERYANATGTHATYQPQ